MSKRSYQNSKSMDRGITAVIEDPKNESKEMVETADEKVDEQIEEQEDSLIESPIEIEPLNVEFDTNISNDESEQTQEEKEIDEEVKKLDEIRIEGIEDDKVINTIDSKTEENEYSKANRNQRVKKQVTFEEMFGYYWNGMNYYY